MAGARDRGPGSKTGSEKQHQCADGLLREPARTLRVAAAGGTDKPRVSRSMGRRHGDRGLQRGRGLAWRSSSCILSTVMIRTAGTRSSCMRSKTAAPDGSRPMEDAGSVVRSITHPFFSLASFLDDEASLPAGTDVKARLQDAYFEQR